MQSCAGRPTLRLTLTSLRSGVRAAQSPQNPVPLPVVLTDDLVRRAPRHRTETAQRPSDGDERVGSDAARDLEDLPHIGFGEQMPVLVIARATWR